MALTEDYTVGWICALEIEFAAACDALDEEFTTRPRLDSSDHNSYCFGRIHEHNVVIACLPKGRYGLTSAAVTAERIRTSFPCLRFGLMVGIAGGAPSEKHDIRLGDVVVSAPTGKYGGVLQYDFGKTIQNHEFEETGYLAPPPEILLNAVTNLNVQQKRYGHRLVDTIQKLQKKSKAAAEYYRPVNDRLCESSYVHSEDCDCQTGASHMVARQLRTETRIHYGLIASANNLMRDAMVRDSLVSKHEVLCFEMEAAGLMNHWPCLVVRGICDYSDSHKNKEWQGYAAASATAYAYELLETIPGRSLKQGFVPFSLEEVPTTARFVDRPAEMLKLENALLSDIHRRKVFILHGLGGIGKTQLAVEFMRLHNAHYTAVLWLDGSDLTNLRGSLIRQASRIPASDIWDPLVNHGSADSVVHAVLGWLAEKGNKEWLMVIDNIDLEFTSDPLSYDIKQYLPSADHGAILITTRLLSLRQLGTSCELEKADREIALEILRSWCDVYGDVDVLLEKLDGLPLALAQAGAFLSESGVNIETYLRLYDSKEQEVTITVQDLELQDYPHRSVWTTWLISYQAIRERDRYVANLLVFWSFINQNGLWFQLFEPISKIPEILDGLKLWLGDIVTKEITFIKAMSLLRRYSLIESGHSDTYSMHTVVHWWIYLIQGQFRQSDIGILALGVIGANVPEQRETDHQKISRRILPHAQTCQTRLLNDTDGLNDDSLMKDSTLLAIYQFGVLFHMQSRFMIAETTYLRAFPLRERLSGSGHQQTLAIARTLGLLYRTLKRYDDAEKWLIRAIKSDISLPITNIFMLRVLNELALVWFEDNRREIIKHEATAEILQGILGSYDRICNEETTESLYAMHCLSSIYRRQERFAEAEAMILRAIQGKKKLLGEKHIFTLDSLRSLALLRAQSADGYQEAEHLYIEVYEGYKEAYGSNNPETCNAAVHLAVLYRHMKKFNDAEKMHRIAMEGYESAPDPLVARSEPALDNSAFLGQLYMCELDKPAEAQAIFEKAVARAGPEKSESRAVKMCRYYLDAIKEENQG